MCVFGLSICSVVYVVCCVLRHGLFVLFCVVVFMFVSVCVYEAVLSVGLRVFFVRCVMLVVYCLLL